MDLKKIVKNVNSNTDSEKLLNAVVKLLEIAHTHGADEEAAKALSDCGIELVLSEEAEQ